MEIFIQFPATPLIIHLQWIKAIILMSWTYQKENECPNNVFWHMQLLVAEPATTICLLNLLLFLNNEYILYCRFDTMQDVLHWLNKEDNERNDFRSRDRNICRSGLCTYYVLEKEVKSDREIAVTLKTVPYF